MDITDVGFVEPPESRHAGYTTYVLPFVIPRFLAGGPEVPAEQEPGPDDEEKIPYGVMEYQTLNGTVTLTYDSPYHPNCFFSALLPVQPPTPRGAKVIKPLGVSLLAQENFRGKRASHCHRGHPLTDDNVYIDKNNRKRRCKTCLRLRKLEAQR